MRNRAIALIVAALFTFGSATVAVGRDSGPQTETGTVRVMTPHPQDTNICFQGVARRAYVVSNGAVNSVAGHVFAIDKSTWSGKFKLDVVSGSTNSEDLDIYYFIDMGKVGPDDPALLNPVEAARYEERKKGGEAGTVPKLAKWGIVCLHTGANAEFKYEAKPPVKKRPAGKSKKRRP